MSVSRPGSAPAPTLIRSPANGPVDGGGLVAVLAVVALVMTYYLAVLTRTGQILDTGAMTVAARYLGDVSWAPVLLTAISPWTVLMATALLALFAWARRGVAVAVAATVTAMGTMVVAVVLKAVLTRPMIVDGSLNSLPSGHVAAVAGISAGATLVAQPTRRLLVALGGLAAVAVTGLATLALEWHRPSDVLAAALIAVAVVSMTRSLGVRRSWRPTRDRSRPRDW